MNRRGYIGNWQQLRWAGRQIKPKKMYAYERGQHYVYNFIHHDAGFTAQPLPESLQFVRGYRTKTSQGTDYTNVYSVTFPLRLDVPGEDLNFGFVLSVLYDSTTHQLKSYLALMRMNNHAGCFEEYNSENPNYGKWQTQHPWQIMAAVNSRIYCWYVGEEIINNVMNNPVPDFYANGIPVSNALCDWIKSQNADTVGLNMFNDIKNGTGSYWTRAWQGVYGSGNVYDQTVLGSGLTRVFKKTGAAPYYTGNILNYIP